MCGLLVGCARTQEATFENYVGNLSGQVIERTGKARVTLEDGTQVIAECPALGLTKGTRVTVEQTDAGWVVR